MAGVLHTPFIGTADGGNDAWTVLLMHMDGAGAAYVDATGRHAISVAAGTPNQISGSGKFGDIGGSFGGGGTLGIPDSADWAFGTGDFTIDFWVRFNSVSGPAYVVINRANGGAGYSPFIVGLPTAGSLCAWASGGAAWNINAGAIGSVTTGIWYHVAFMRLGNNFYGSLNGEVVLLGTYSGALMDSSSSLYIGGDSNTNRITADLDEFRITKGIARWPVSFTPPVRAYC